MKERPILMSAPMVRATLNGSKSQTRRVVRGVQRNNCLPLRKATKTRAGLETHVIDAPKHGLCPYGQPGDRLWVKETWCTPECWDSAKPTDLDPAKVPIDYAADFERNTIVCGRFRPSIFMRRWMSRITLEIVSVRVDRLQQISEADAIAEGVGEFGENVPGCDTSTPKDAYEFLWNQINGPGSWDLNPWVWVVEFRRITP